MRQKRIHKAYLCILFHCKLWKQQQKTFSNNRFPLLNFCQPNSKNAIPKIGKGMGKLKIISLLYYVFLKNGKQESTQPR